MLINFNAFGNKKCVEKQPIQRHNRLIYLESALYQLKNDQFKRL